MSFSKLSIDINETGAPITRAMNNINNQSTSDNHINDIVNGIAPNIQTGGKNNYYNKIYDFNKNKYVSIKSKIGTKIVNSYINKLKRL